MEDGPKEPSVIRRVVAEIVAGLRLVGRHMGQTDLNPPHEGRLRSSIMPAEYMGIPDAPPAHDDTM